ncbi:MAG: OmpA family protein [Pseudomonadota bacterium]
MKNKNLILAILFLGFGFAKAAAAKDALDNRWYVAPSVSYLWNDADRQTARDAYGLTVGVGKALDENFNLELKAFYNDLDSHSHNPDRAKYDWNNLGSTLDLQYYLNRNDIAPYAVVGLGFMNGHTNGQDALGLVAEAGVGVAYKIDDKISLRTDIRYRYNNSFGNSTTINNASKYDDMIVNVGLVIPFGSASTTNSSAANVQNSTEALQRVGFGFGSAALSVDSKTTLDETVQKIIVDANNKQVEIQGHASSEGNAKFNQVLSQKRAKSVANYLIKKGIAKDKIITKGYGSKMPIADNKTKAGRAKNRRVDIILK